MGECYPRASKPKGILHRMREPGLGNQADHGCCLSVTTESMVCGGKELPPLKEAPRVAAHRVTKGRRQSILPSKECFTVERGEGEPVGGQGSSQETAGDMQMPITPTFSQTTEVLAQGWTGLWAQVTKSKNLKAFLVTTVHCLDRNFSSPRHTKGCLFQTQNSAQRLYSGGRRAKMPPRNSPQPMTAWDLAHQQPSSPRLR